MIMHLVLNCKNQQRSKNDFRRKKERLSIEPREYNLSATQEIQLLLRNELALLNMSNNNRNLINQEEMKRFKNEERCLQDF